MQTPTTTDRPPQSPRKRGCISRCWRLCWRSAAVLIVLYLGLAVYYSVGSPKVSVDYVAKTNERAAAVAESDRAWPVYRAALLAMGLEDRRDNPNAKLLSDGDSPEDERWEEAGAYVASHPEAVAQLRVAAGMPGLGYIAGFEIDEVDWELFPEKTPSWGSASSSQATDQTLISLLLPHLGMLRQASRVLSIDALLAAEQGDAQTCLADLLALSQMGRHADEQNTLISQLVRISLNAKAIHTVNRVICEYPELLDDAQLAALAEAVASIREMTLDYEGERMMFDDVVQHLYTDNGRGGGHMAAGREHVFTGLGTPDRGVGPAVVRFFFAPVVAIGSASRRDLTEEYHRMMDLAQAQADIPPWREPESDVTEAVSEYHGTLIRRYRYRLVVTLLPALGATRNVAARYEANAEAALAGISIQQYHRANGAYPDTLDALVPQYLDAVPIDHMNGNPLRYHLGEDGPVLYSVGADGDDDGGRAPGEYERWGPLAGSQAGPQTGAQARQWVADQYAAARWNESDPADGDWVTWPLHNIPVMPEPESDEELGSGYLIEDE